MSNFLSNPATQTVAILTAFFAQPLVSKDPEFISSFEQSLQNMYSTIRDNKYFPPEAIQAVKLVGDLLKA